MEAAIYFKQKENSDYEGILAILKAPNIVALDEYYLSVKDEFILSFLNDQYIKKNLEDYIFELVKLTKTTYKSGKYYAHEYDIYVEGKARRITYSNGFIEYEIKCLDNSLAVLDGFWQGFYGSHLSNGYGDTFELFEDFDT